MSLNKPQVNQPCICDLNPIELAWTEMKRCVKSQKYDKGNEFKGVQQLVRSALDIIMSST